MFPTVTIWTSFSTVPVQSRVAQIISATREEGNVINTISLAGLNETQVKASLNTAFNRLVSMTMSDSTLHLVAIIPLFEENTIEQIQTLYNACDSLEHNISLHILGIGTELRFIFNAQSETLFVSDIYTESCELLRSLAKKASFSLSYSVIDDYAENGASIGFTIESISHYISLIYIALIQDYYAILSPALISSHLGDNLSIGTSSLSFNRQSVIRQMLGLSFLEALDNVGINNNEVDAQKAAREAETFLEGISERYSNLFEHSIRPLYKEEGLDEGHVVARVASILDEDINALKSEILSLLKSNSLSLPEKEVILALILGRDNENLRGMQYEHEGALLDDACEKTLNIYIEAFNRYCKDSEFLPVRGDFEALKKYVWDENEKEYEESPENYEALNPLKDIKRLKQDIINNTSFIRDKQDELIALQKSIRQRKDVEDIKSKWHRPKGVFKDIEYKEQPLDEQYTPPLGLKIKGSVDLRKFFSPVKNQLSLGACTSFAAVAMYEAMMNRDGVSGPFNMSPAYLYYYSNVIKGRHAGGSNFFEQLEVLGSHGVCHEDLYIYDVNSPQIQPSPQAEEDAKKHRVISAKQIPLINEHDKSYTLKRNHELLTSALSEGYPIGISLKIYDNLGKDGAFILHPDDVPNAHEEGWHAMVIVGYSEENNFYIVRNSWGSEFGEDGYCYIPTAYIDDPDYMNFACIITETSDNLAYDKIDVPTVIANFAATESEIRIAAIRNVIAKIRIDLKNNQNLYTEYYKYYQRLVMQLSMPKVQNGIRSAAETAQILNYIDVDSQKRQLEESFIKKIKEYKSHLKYIILSLGAITLGLGISWFFSQNIVILMSFLILLGICSLNIIGYKWWKRIKRRNLQEELDQVSIEAKHQAEMLFEMQIRFHVAGMWLQRFHNLSLEIGNVYDRIVSYNSSLRGWQQDYSRQIGAIEIPEGQMFKTLDASQCLQNFFEQNKSVILKEVDLIKLFEDFQVDPNTLEDYHQKLQIAVYSVIYSLMNDFNIVNFLLGKRYPYLYPINLQDEISSLINVGQPSFRNKIMNATPSVHILLVNVLDEQKEQWINVINTLFPVAPIQLTFGDPTLLILITIHPIE